MMDNDNAVITIKIIYFSKNNCWIADPTRD